MSARKNIYIWVMIVSTTNFSGLRAKHAKHTCEYADLHIAGAPDVNREGTIPRCSPGLSVYLDFYLALPEIDPPAGTMVMAKVMTLRLLGSVMLFTSLVGSRVKVYARNWNGLPSSVPSFITR